MKNLLIHINGSDYEWQKEVEPLLKIQIDNSQLYWKREDIILVTNFPYEYNGVKALVVPGSCFFKMRPTVTKVKVILYLFEQGLIGDDLYWFHDLDAFQLAPVIVDFKEDMALTDYGVTTIRESYNNRWSTGSWFFKKSAKGLFQMILGRCLKDKVNEEAALGRIIKDNPAVGDRVHKLNITYNVATRKRDVEKTLEQATKPIKVLHFHPFDTRKLWNGLKNMQYCPSLMSPELINIFKQHGL